MGKWKWRSIREFAFGVEVWPLNWRPFFDREFNADEAGGEARVVFGPLVLRFVFNDGRKV